VAAAFRDEWGRIVAALIRRTGDWDLAEECAQEAFAQALRRWPSDGVPARPGAWLTAVARNRAIDRLRRARRGAELMAEVGAGGARETEVETMDEHDGDVHHGDTDESGIEDDRLRLIFTCCHPALALEARVALTLRTLAGLTTAEIAHAFLVPEPTMAKRLVRAKAKIAGAGIPYRVPPAHLLPERTGGVLAVLYLLFNEGYAASGGADLIRLKLCDEAIRLARALAGLMPDEPEAAGLLALMLFHHARRGARQDAAGDVITLEDQDRGLWDRHAIEEADALLQAALRHGRAGWVGPYQLQAAIAACHTGAPDAASIDWAQIAALYDLLVRIVPSPVVELNRAVAVAMSRGLDAGLEVLGELESSGRLDGYHLLAATRADLLRRLDRREEAAAAYREALALVGSEAERRFLVRRLNEVTAAA
jgi:RNA polymerase sigma-70 factor (ECF subfamily)